MKGKKHTAPPASRFASSPVELDVLNWQKAAAALEAAKAQELAARLRLAKQFPNPKEGANKLVLGRLTVTLTQKINRKLDRAVLDNILPKLPKKYQAEGYLIDWKPELQLKAYRELAEDKRLHALFAQCLTETCGTPSITATIGAA